MIFNKLKFIELTLIYLRYADVLLMYAEAKIEADDIDQTVLDAINKVRARAYGCDYTETDKYPEVTEKDQDALRKIVRAERRMELAYEGWKWFFPYTPEIDDDGIALGQNDNY